MAAWTNIYDLWEDIERFARTHRDYKFMAADSPGISFGWVALREDGNNEEWWTINLVDMKKTLPRHYDAEALIFRQQMGTAVGRRALCAQLREPPQPRTRWQRLMET